MFKPKAGSQKSESGGQMNPLINQKSEIVGGIPEKLPSTKSFTSIMRTGSHSGGVFLIIAYGLFLHASTL
jgi:hypothetical protein